MRILKKRKQPLDKRRQNAHDVPEFLEIASQSAVSPRISSNLNDPDLFRSPSEQLYDKYTTQGYKVSVNKSSSKEENIQLQLLAPKENIKSNDHDLIRSPSEQLYDK